MADPKTRHIDLVNSKVGAKFFMLARDEDLAITTCDSELSYNNINLIPEYYSTSKVDGKKQYNYKLTVPNFIKRSEDNILLMDLKTSRGDDVLVYLDKTKNNKRPLLTIYNPKGDLAVAIHPGTIVEVVFVNPERPLSLPHVDQSFTAFDMELLRREIVHEKDEVFRPYQRLFDIRRWVVHQHQIHFFFRVNPKNYEMFKRAEWDGYMFGPIVNFMNSGSPVNIKFKVYMNKKIKEGINTSNDFHGRIANEAHHYGTESGSFCGAQVMACNSKSIIIDRETGFQEVEIPIPVFNATDWPGHGYKAKMIKNDSLNLTGRIQQNGFRIVNGTFLQKFLVISDLSKIESGIDPIGNAEFICQDRKLNYPIYIGKVESPKIKQTIKEETRFERPDNTRQYLCDLSSSYCFRKVSVAKDVRLIKIENDNQLLTEKIISKTERIVEDPANEETICIFPDEILTVRLTNQVIRWSLSTWPSFINPIENKFYKNVEEFKFKVSHCYITPFKLHLSFESGKIKKKIFIKLIL